MRTVLFFLLSLAILGQSPLSAKHHIQEETPWQEPSTEDDRFYLDAVVESYYEETAPEETFTYTDITDQEEEEVIHPYRLRIGDTLLISIYGESETQRQVIVDPTGSISFQFITSLPVVGKTLKEVRDDFQERLSTYYRFPLISITPIKFAGSFYTILGEVNQPGKKLIEGTTTVLSALCGANGLVLRSFRNQLGEQADLDRSFLARNGDIVPLDFAKLVYEGDMSQDIPLEQGDFIFVETAQQNQVYVLGMVEDPVAIDFIHTISLIEALSEAGRVYPYASSRVVVVRGSLACPVTYLIDINLIQKGKACDFLLEPGDIVYVPPMKFTNLKELTYGAIRSFVNTAISRAGTNTFVRIHPHASGDKLLGPVPTTSIDTFVP